MPRWRTDAARPPCSGSTRATAEILEEMEQPLARRLNSDAWTRATRGPRVDAISPRAGGSRGAPSAERRQIARGVGSGARRWRDPLGSPAGQSGRGRGRVGCGRVGRLRLEASQARLRRAVAEASALAWKRPTPEAVRALVEAGKKLPALCPRVAQLEATLEEHAAWVEAARERSPAPPEVAAARARRRRVVGGGGHLRGRRGAGGGARRVGRARTRRSRRARRRGSGAAATAARRPSPTFGRSASSTTASARARRAIRARREVESRLEKRRAADFVDARSAMRRPPSLKMLSRGVLVAASALGGGRALAAAAAAAALVRAPPPDAGPPASSSAGTHAAAVEDTASALRVVAQSIRAAIADLEGTGEPPESEEGSVLPVPPAGRQGDDRLRSVRRLVPPAVRAGHRHSARTAKHYVCPGCAARARGRGRLRAQQAGDHAPPSSTVTRRPAGDARRSASTRR